jgi:putative oxidoreductase
MWRAITRTTDDRSLLFLRLILAGVMWPHGAQKVLGWFGGYGLEGSFGYLTKTIGAPAPFAALAIAAEFLGPLALLLGVLGRVAAVGIAGVMAVAVATVHLPNGFFMNWSGTQGGEGFEYHILMAAIALVIVVRGSGAYSIDRVLSGAERRVAEGAWGRNTEAAPRSAARSTRTRA